ncbi:MAG: glycosyltransferase family 39 protein [Desulfobacteraceae bacterium]|nr:glycosyltransferase family 39 protein [Desulfobacteraceae bacterium]
MNSGIQRYNMALACLLVGLCFLFRLYYAQAFLLVPDETNYWQWARHLSWGYHDQAPMIGWTIFLSTKLFGHTELGVRLPSILSMLIASIYLVLFARRWFSSNIALQTAILSQVILAFNVGGLLATADGLQSAAWIAASYHAARAFENNHWRQWLIGGLCFGFGMLSKYTMVLFLPCVFAFGLVSKNHRRMFLSIRPYCACLIGLLLFSPVVLWNASNNWNSLRHVAYIGGVNEGFALNFNFLGDYIASQAALLTPLVFIVICLSWFVTIRRFKTVRWINVYLLFTSLPVIAGFGLLSLHTRVYGNWPGFGYLTATVLAASYFALDSRKTSVSKKPQLTALWRWTTASAAVLTAIVLIHTVWPILPLPVKMDRTAGEVLGWDQLGQITGRVKSKMSETKPVFVFGLKYQLASELAFYIPGQPPTVSINRWRRPNVYDYWYTDQDLLGMDAVGVTQNNNSRKRLLEVFERVEQEPESYTVYQRPVFGGKFSEKEHKKVKIFYIYRCYGFKGGLRWEPPNEKDIRGSASVSPNAVQEPKYEVF